MMLLALSKSWVCVVADRGTMSAETIAGLEARQLDYIIGARERNDALVKNIVMKNDKPFVPLLIERQVGETQLFVKEVKIEGKRYIVCRNESEAENDRQERERIVAALDAQLKKGDKALIGNSAYRRYLRKTRGTRDTPAFEIDAGKLAEEARFDGIFVLRTNAKVTPLQAVLRYRDLLKVENLFLRTKAVINLGQAWFAGGSIRVHNGEPDSAIAHFEYAMRLSPFDPFITGMWRGIALAHLLAGRYDQSLSASEHGLPNHVADLTVLAASSALAGRMDKARAAMARIRKRNPTLCISTLKALTPFRRPEDFARWAKGLRLAGLPE